MGTRTLGRDDSNAVRAPTPNLAAALRPEHLI
jgi:hypothetical protein